MRLLNKLPRARAIVREIYMASRVTIEVLKGEITVSEVVFQLNIFTFRNQSNGKRLVQSSRVARSHCSSRWYFQKDEL
jgi:hypothetical protein